MTTSTDGSNESENSGKDSKGNLEHSQSISPGSMVRRTLLQPSLTKKVFVITALIIAVKTGAILVFGDNAYLTALMDLLLQSLQESVSN